MKTSLLLGALGLAGVLSIGVASAGDYRSGGRSSVYDKQGRDYYGYGRQADVERNGVMDLGDVRRAARQAFNDKRNGDNTVDLNEFAPSATWDRFSSIEKYGDDNLNRRQFLTAIDDMFDEVDRNNDGVLDNDELRSTKGRALLRVIR
jgi:hypothetical protein